MNVTSDDLVLTDMFDMSPSSGSKYFTDVSYLQYLQCLFFTALFPLLLV